MGSKRKLSSYAMLDMVYDRGYHSPRNKGKDVEHRIKVSLEEMYNGITKRLSLQKNVICDKCKGRGGKEGAVSKCSTCRGSGIQVKVQQLGPRRMHKIQSMCPNCDGKGKQINPKDRCRSCNGKKVVTEIKILEIHVDKGMANGQKVVFHGEGDQEPGLEPGDVVIVLVEKKHAVFHRQNENLLIKLELSITEALCGFQKVITTLDDREIVVSTIPGEVIKYGDVKSVVGEGMPVYRDPFQKGHLIIQFKVAFPPNHWTQTNKIKELECLLPPKNEIVVTNHMEKVDLHAFGPNQFASERRGRNAQDEDDQEGHSKEKQCQIN